MSEGLDIAERSARHGRPATFLARERSALAAHRETLRGSVLPPPKHAPKATFLHGFLLLFSLIASTLRDRELRAPYLRVAFARGLLVVFIGALAVTCGDFSVKDSKRERHTGIVVSNSKHGDKATPVRVDLPGLHVDIDGEGASPEVSVLGVSVPVTTVEAGEEGRRRQASAPVAREESKPSTFLRRAWDSARASWGFLLALLGFLSATEFVIVFLSRRWDDWMSFHASRLVAIRPEDETPKTPRIAFDLRWLYRKVKRRVRGYVVFAAGLPALLPLNLVPTVGPWIWSLAVTAWGWYWLGVFSAAKSAHAWADEASAPSPRPIRALNDNVARGFAVAPLRYYGRLWARVTRGVNPAAATFERTPAPFLGLALARAILSLPGLYLLARPLVPVAAGRLCAEADPFDRFSTPDQPVAAAWRHGSARMPCAAPGPWV